MFELSPDPCPAKTRADLEWDRVLSAVAERCASVPGRLSALELPFRVTREGVRAALAETAEATLLRQEGALVPVVGLDDVREAVERLRTAGVLSGPELRALARLLHWARSLRRFLTARKDRVPALYAACATDPTLDAVADEVAGCFDAAGTLADHASPRLKELRSEYRASRGRMMSRLEELMSRYADIVQDHFVTEREGRYVLPIRADAHQRFPGIVHSASGSGGTIFVEPRAVVPMGNRLKMLEAEVYREEIVIYTNLSAKLMAVLPSVLGALEAVARADVCAAVSRLAEEYQLTFPEIVDEPRLDLKDARHLLLCLELPNVVPSDVRVASGRAIVVSGPNAGGKTVALKTAGLAALLVRAGLPVPCAEGSVVGIFDLVLTDVGDDQSLHKSLSTFSAHVKNLASILDETRPGALVLLDELAGGTDPREGEALAAGVLDSLCARGGAVVVTTHYEGLKALALGDPRFENACVGFDLATMTPTFRMTLGLPGSSSALSVARRYGLPSTVLERAERFLSREDRTLEEEVRRVHDERAALELARAAAEEERRQAGLLRTRLEGELAMARDREKQAVSREGEAVLAGLKRAREELRAAQARLRSKKVGESDVREASRALDRVAGTVAIGGEFDAIVGSAAAGDTHAELPASELRPGVRVWVPRLRAEAEVLDVLPGAVRVAAGAMKLVVDIAELRAASAAAPRRESRTPRLRTAPEPPVRADEVAMQTTDNTCDLRGLRVDDALSLAGTFLDRAINQGRRVLFFVHGHGTGALREAVRKELGASRFVARFRSGESGEGGEGVTVAWLA
ncbi:MAG TPA: Smr/MutS family protein [Polyangiaceae bacterium]